MSIHNKTVWNAIQNQNILVLKKKKLVFLFEVSELKKKNKLKVFSESLNKKLIHCKLLDTSGLQKG